MSKIEINVESLGELLTNVTAEYCDEANLSVVLGRISTGLRTAELHYEPHHAHAKMIAAVRREIDRLSKEAHARENQST